MIITRWHNLFSITVTTFLAILIVHISPVFANSRLSLPIYSNISSKITVADNALATNEPNFPSVLHQLNLSSIQKDRIKRIHHQYKQQIIRKKSNLSILEQQLSDLMVGTESVELIRAKNRQLVDLRQEIGQLRFESMLATREILTPQQRQKFREIIESQLAR